MQQPAQFGLAPNQGQQGCRQAVQQTARNRLLKLSWMLLNERRPGRFRLSWPPGRPALPGAKKELLHKLMFAIPKQGRDLSQLSSGDMLNVFNSGNPKEVGKMFKQVTDTTGVDAGATYNEATQRL